MTGETFPTGAQTVVNDTSASGSRYTVVAASGAGGGANYYSPGPIPAGTYTLKYRYQKGPGRGQHTVSVDAVQIGGTIDEYSSTTGFVEVTVGTVTFSSSSYYVITLGVNGKNSASSGYSLAPDLFTFVAQ